MAQIKQLINKGEIIYPNTVFNAVLYGDGTTLAERYEYIRDHYSRISDIVNNLDIQFDPSTRVLKLVLDNTLLSAINTDNFAVTGIIDSASYSNDILTLHFSSGDTVGIDVSEIAESLLSEYKDEVAALRRLHTVMSNADFDDLRTKDPNVFYYVYEDDEENNEET